MSITLDSFMVIALLAVILTVYFTVYQRENMLFYIVLGILSVLMYLKTGDMLIFLVTYISSISAIFLYTTRFYIPYFLLFFLSAVEIYYGNVSSLSLAIALGTITSLVLSREISDGLHRNGLEKGIVRDTEIRRDIFQIITGILAIAVLLIFGMVHGESIVLVLILLLYITGNLAQLDKDTQLSKSLFSFERNNVNLGAGSILLAVGVLLVFGLVHSFPIIIMAMFLVLIADPVATIAGKTIGGAHLPYNPGKTVSGFVSALLVSLLFSLIIYPGNFYMILIAAAGTFVESATREPLDDNLTIPVTVIILSFVFTYF